MPFCSAQDPHNNTHNIIRHCIIIMNSHLSATALWILMSSTIFLNGQIECMNSNKKQNYIIYMTYQTISLMNYIRDLYNVTYITADCV